MPEYCDRENCWEPPTKELADEHDECDGFYCDHHAAARIKYVYHKLHVVSVAQAEKAA